MLEPNIIFILTLIPSLLSLHLDTPETIESRLDNENQEGKEQLH
jgi:hypothetical protein